ncbi:nitrite reductase (NAD(P)H) small subunit [Escherichia coli]
MKFACQLNDILPGTGVCALIEGALRSPCSALSAAAEVFAIDNRDPFFAANVLSRGLICGTPGRLWVASPLKKQRFRLSDGHCFENPARCRCRALPRRSARPASLWGFAV